MRIAHTCLRVADADRAVAWYAENFGFEETWSWEWETDEGTEVNRYVADDRGSELQLVETAGRTAFEEGDLFDHFGVVVDDVDDAFDRIDNHGVDLEPTDNPDSGARIAFIRDPDGHRIELLAPFDD